MERVERGGAPMVTASRICIFLFVFSRASPRRFVNRVGKSRATL